MLYGYVRVSTYNQNLDRQYNEMIKFGIKKDNIFIDKLSGKDFKRPNYNVLISLLKENDLIVVKSIDRLGRNYDMVISEWKHITNDLKANILVLDMPLLDTRDNGNKLIGKLISDIVLQILSFVAENERIQIKERQAEGIKIAKEKGIRFGRPTKKINKNIINKLINNELSFTYIIKKYNISKSSLYRYIKDAKK